MNTNLCAIELTNDIPFETFEKLLLKKADTFYLIDEDTVNDSILYNIISVLQSSNKKFCIRSRNVDVISDCKPDVIRVSNNWDNSEGVIDSIIDYGLENEVPIIFEIHAFSNNCLLGSLSWCSLYPSLTYEFFIQEFSFEEINKIFGKNKETFIRDNFFFRDIPNCFMSDYSINNKSIYIPDYTFSIKGFAKTNSFTFTNRFFKSKKCELCNQPCLGIYRNSKDLSKYITSISIERNIIQEDLTKKFLLKRGVK